MRTWLFVALLVTAGSALHQEDALMFNTPNGIALVDVARIGTNAARLDIVASRARGGYFARRTREIYYSGSGSGTVTAVNIDTRRTREVPYAHGLINADETLAVVKSGNADDPCLPHHRA